MTLLLLLGSIAVLEHLMQRTSRRLDTRLEADLRVAEPVHSVPSDATGLRALGEAVEHYGKGPTPDVQESPQLSGSKGNRVS